MIYQVNEMSSNVSIFLKESGTENRDTDREEKDCWLIKESGILL